MGMGFLASPVFQMILGAAGQGQSGQNAGMGALAGLQSSANMQRSQAATQLMNQQAQDEQKLGKFMDQWIAGQGSQSSIPPGLQTPQPAPAAPNPRAGMIAPQPQVTAMAPQVAASPQVMSNAPSPSPMVQQAQTAPTAPPPQRSVMPQQPAAAAAAPQAAPQAPPQAPQPGMFPGGRGMLPVFQQMMKYRGTRAQGVQGILGMHKVPAETWGPMSPDQRKAYGIAPGDAAQISSRGKGAGIGGGGVTVNTGPGKPPAGYAWDGSGNLVPIEGGPATKPSAQEAKQQAQSELGMRLLDEVDTLVSGGDLDNPDAPKGEKMETGTVAWLRATAAANGLLSWMVDLTPKEAKVASNLETLSNTMLQAMRGANVGPEEQVKFERQLPRLGQDDELFAANLKATKENLAQITARMVELRKQKQSQTPPPPPGFRPVP